MSPSPFQDPAKTSSPVQALQNEVTTGSVMTTAPTGNILTGGAGVNITVQGPWYHSRHQMETLNAQDTMADGYSSSTPLLRSASLPRTISGSEYSTSYPTLPGLTSPGFPPDSQIGVANLCEPLPCPTSTTLDGYGEHFEAVAGRVTEAYSKVLSRLKKIKRSKDTRSRLCQIVVEQKSTYGLMNTYLIKAIGSLASSSTLVDISTTLETCELIRGFVENLWSQLHLVISGIESFGSRNEAQDQSISPETKRKALDRGINALEGCLEDFKKFVRLIKDDSTPDQHSKPKTEDAKRAEIYNLRKLSFEGQVSSLLCRCLCRACSKKCHDQHIAYFSLEPEDEGERLIRTSEGSDKTIWKCHMAFKSNVTKKTSLIWLRAESSVSSAGQRHIQEEEKRPNNTPDQSLKETSDNTASPTNNFKKRRATSTPPEPPKKAPKTRPGPIARGISEPAPPTSPTHGFEVCPEILGQHDNPDHFVMNMVDDNGCDHDLFYLAKEARPLYKEKGGKPITLSRILDASRGKHRSEYTCTTLWVLQVSRLIAEAVLRFDLKDRDPNPVDSVVFYKSAKSDLAPFLEVEITKSALDDHSDAAAADGGDRSPSSRERSELLLNIGQILLQLGLAEKPLKFPQDSNGRRSLIRQKASDTCIIDMMGEAYSNVIMTCVKLSGEWEKHRCFEEQFKERYYRSVVKPLKDMEDALRSQKTM